MEDFWSDLGFYITKFHLNSYEQIINKFDRVLKKNPGIKYSPYLSTLKQYHHILLKLEKIKLEEEEIKKRTGLPPLFSKEPYELEDKLRYLKIRIGTYHQTFNPNDAINIQNFISPCIQDDTKVIEFLDKLGAPNFKEFCLVIDELKMMFLKNKITEKDVENIRLIILSRKGIINI